MALKPYHNLPERASWRHRLRLILPLLVLLGLVGGLVKVWLDHSDRLFFYLRKDRYQEIEKKLGAARSQIEQGHSDQPAVQDFQALIENLTADHVADGYLFYLRGEYYSTLVLQPLQNNQNILWDIFFEDYLDRYHFPEEINKELWYNAIVSYRKALRLGLNVEAEENASVQLARLYLLGGKAYSAAGVAMALKFPAKTAREQSIYAIFLPEKIPDWNLLKESILPDAVQMWQAIYYLRSGNSPLGFSLLGSLLKTENAQLRNNALYLLGKTMGVQKKTSGQLFYYRQVDLDEFLPRQAWFLEEYIYSLRYAGDKKEAEKILEKYSLGQTEGQ